MLFILSILFIFIDVINIIDIDNIIFINSISVENAYLWGFHTILLNFFLEQANVNTNLYNISDDCSILLKWHNKEKLLVCHSRITLNAPPRCFACKQFCWTVKTLPHRSWGHTHHMNFRSHLWSKCSLNHGMFLNRNIDWKSVPDINILGCLVFLKHFGLGTWLRYGVYFFRHKDCFLHFFCHCDFLLVFIHTCQPRLYSNHWCKNYNNIASKDSVHQSLIESEFESTTSQENQFGFVILVCHKNQQVIIKKQCMYLTKSRLQINRLEFSAK